MNQIEQTYLQTFIFNNYDNFVKENSKNTIFIFIPDIPTPDFSLSDCVKSLNENNNHVNQCNFNIDKFIENRLIIDEIIKKLTLNNKNVYIFDFVKNNCSNNSCLFFYDSYKPIYSRKNHFSVEFSEHVSKDFYSYLDQIK